MDVDIVDGAETMHLIQARDDRDLRACTDRIGRLLAVVQKRMAETQFAWGGGHTVLDDPGVAELPLVVRQAKAVEKVLAEMPIAIEDDDLIVGNTVEDGAIMRPQMPEYASAAEREQARKEGAGIGAGLSHKTPYYYDVLNRGLLAILEDVDQGISEVAARPASAARDETLAL